jgi:LPS O-antigen subunit length determinant protein (WzzB/FepE family)
MNAIQTYDDIPLNVRQIIEDQHDSVSDNDKNVITGMWNVFFHQNRETAVQSFLRYLDRLGLVVGGRIKSLKQRKSLRRKSLKQSKSLRRKSLKQRK